MIKILWQVLDSAIYPLLLVMAMWVTFLFNLNYHWQLELFGLQPHNLKGLRGIIFMPFLHENFEHLFSNTIPLLVAGSFLFYYFKNWTWFITAAIWFLGGLILWFIGENSTNHIGASGLVYGWVFFLLISGIIRGHRHLAAVALLMVFLYGSLVWGMFPEYVKLMRENISWEGHLAGAFIGTSLAFILIKKGPQKPIEMSIDEEENESDELPYWMIDNENLTEEEIIKPTINDKPNEPNFNYRYVPKNANPWEKDD
jgi:membrane associated rhomboid family serine protease